MSDLVARLEREMKRPNRSRAQKRARWWIFIFLAVAFPLVAIETGLRLGHYHRPQIRMDVQIATNRASAATLNQRFATNAFVPDRFLLWRQQPGANLCGLDVDKQGILTTGDVPRPAEGKRILCLGDSVTATSYRTYPHIAQRLLHTVLGPKRFEFTNAAVAGYSTEQGLRWFSRLRTDKPDIVLVCFGWNDQFPALNLPDKELGARNALAAAAHRVFYWSRIYQYLSAPRRHNGFPEPTTTETLRVAPAEFERNLRKFIADVGAGTTCVLATQPDNLGAATQPYFDQQKFSSNALLQRHHEEYNRIVRQVAATAGAPLVDFAEEFDRRNKQYLFDPDGMHLSGPGHNLAARLLISELRNQRLISPDEFQRVVQAARYDTTAPDKPHVAWVVDPAIVSATTTQTLRIGVLAKNTGNSVFLTRHVVPKFGAASNVAYGGTTLTGKWRTQGAPTTATMPAVRLSHDLLPGESTSTTLEMAAPPAPGIYGMEIGFHADRLGDLKDFGAEITTLTVVTRAP